MISNNYIPEKINDFNTYLDGNKKIAVSYTHLRANETGRDHVCRHLLGK